ncbi:MAG: hypothetical protein ACON5J_19050 [Rubripirellula sp.]
MSFRDFVDGLCNAGIEATVNGYRLKKVLGISHSGLKLWMQEGLPHSRNEANHLVMDVQELVCWLIDRGKVSHAGRLHDQFNTN